MLMFRETPYFRIIIAAQNTLTQRFLVSRKVDWLSREEKKFKNWNEIEISFLIKRTHCDTITKGGENEFFIGKEHVEKIDWQNTQTWQKKGQKFKILQNSNCNLFSLCYPLCRRHSRSLVWQYWAAMWSLQCQCRNRRPILTQLCRKIIAARNWTARWRRFAFPR
jgi:hypothetical protein